MNKDTLNSINFRTLCHTLILFVLLLMLAANTILVTSPSNMKPVFAQESITPKDDEDNLLDQEWTVEIQSRNLIDQLPPGIVGSLSDEYRFTGNLLFKIIECKEEFTYPKCITGSGKGYVFANGKTGYQLIDPLIGQDCWKNVEGPVTFDVSGPYFPTDVATTPENETQRIFLYLGDKTTPHGRYGCSYSDSSVPGFEGDYTGGIFMPPANNFRINQFAVVTDKVGNSQRIEGIPNFGATPLVLELKDGAKIEHNVGNNYVKITIHGPDCDSKPETPQFKPYNNRLWDAKVGVVDREGLVLQDINLYDSHLLDRLSMPHSKVVLPTGKEDIIRYCSATDQHTEPKVAGDTIQWSFSREFGKDTPDDQSDDGTLTIRYDFIFMSKWITNCERLENICYRFIPLVTFFWNGQDFLKQVITYYKLDYGDGTGLTLVKDSVSDMPVGYRAFVEKETSFKAIKNGAEGEFDNIHNGHVGDYVDIPGCRVSVYDCLHMHWRWAGIFDPMVNPLTNNKFPGQGNEGKPYLARGQTIDIAIVKASSDPSEADPDNPLTLVTNETIATNSYSSIGKTTPVSCQIGVKCVLKSADHPIVWYISSVENQKYPSFFWHGLFSLNTKNKLS